MAKRNNHTLYKTADTVCKKIIMEVVNKTQYKQIKDPDTFYTNVTALKLLDHLTEFCPVLHTVNAVDIPQLTKMLFFNTVGILQFINVMKAAQRNYKRVKPIIQDEYMHAVEIKYLLKSGE